MSIDSRNLVSKLESLEDIGLPELPIEWFIDFGGKCYNHVVEKGLVRCEFVDFNFLGKAKFSLGKVKKNLGIGSF